MAQMKPCPRCQKPLEIPHPPPEQFRCGACNAVIKMKAGRSDKPKVPTATRAASPAPVGREAAAIPPTPPPAIISRRPVFILFILAGLLTICIVPAAGLGLAWVFSGQEKKPADVPVIIVKEEDETPKKIKEPPPPDPRIKIVQPAVDKGVAYLKAQVPNLTGIRCGYVGLNGLTLLECGVPPDDPAILRIAELIRTAAPGMNQTYDLSASLFFLNRWDEGRPLDEKDRKMARSFALRIIAGQLSTGIWSYGGVLMTPEQEAKLVASLQEGTYRPNGPIQVMPSMSNTQFAMLAVWGARKHGVPVRAPLLALAAYFHANQQSNGCWDYPGHGLKATSTCAGLISLATEVALLEDKEFTPTRRQPDSTKKRADADRAFEFVGKTIGRKITDPVAHSQYGGRLFNADAGGDLYFLWTLERVGVIYSKDVIGGNDWYDWGYPIVMKAQQPDGKWNEGHGVLSGGPLSDTCFALLFLKRANIARDLTRIIRTRDGRPIIVP